MPPKGQALSKKAEQKKKEKIIEDKTFGLKNKKGAKTQKYVQQITNQVHCCYFIVYFYYNFVFVINGSYRWDWKIYKSRKRCLLFSSSVFFATCKCEIYWILHVESQTFPKTWKDL